MSQSGANQHVFEENKIQSFSRIESFQEFSIIPIIFKRTNAIFFRTTLENVMEDLPLNLTSLKDIFHT